MKLLHLVYNHPLLRKRNFWRMLILMGLLLKPILFPFKTGDYRNFLLPWINFIETHGYFSALQFDFHNYMPPYIYLLVLIAKMGFNPLFSIKVASVLFEYLLAFFIGKIITLKYKNNLFVWISLAIVPLLPTVMLNSSYLSQCDSIYAAFAVGSIYFLLKKQPWTAALFLGLAFVFKLQTLLLLPFFFVMLLRKQIRFHHFLLLPAIYFLSILPVFLLGRPLDELLSIYIRQSNHYKYLTMNFPNLYIWISNHYYEAAKLAGLCVTFLVTLVAGLLLSRKNLVFTFDQWIRLAFLSAVATPFLLPGMHERYMYMGDVLGIVYLMVIRRNFYFPAGILLVSFYSYIRCSRFHDVLPQAPAFFLYLFLLAAMVWDFTGAFKKAPSEDVSE